MIESHGEHDQRPAHDPMWPGYTPIKELPHPFRRSRTPVHQHGLMPLDPHQSEVLCASPLFYQITKKTSTGPCRDSPGNSPCFYRGNPRVMTLEELMTLVLCIKSIGQWPFTLIDITLEYL